MEIIVATGGMPDNLCVLSSDALRPVAMLACPCAAERDTMRLLPRLSPFAFTDRRPASDVAWTICFLLGGRYGCPLF